MARILAPTHYRLWCFFRFSRNRSRRPWYWRSTRIHYLWYVANCRCTSQSISHYGRIGACRGGRRRRHFISSYGTCRCLAYHFAGRGIIRFYLSRRKCYARHWHRWIIWRRYRQFCSGYRLFARIYQRLSLCYYGRNFRISWAISHFIYIRCYFDSYVKGRRRHRRHVRTPRHHRCFCLGTCPSCGQYHGHDQSHTSHRYYFATAVLRWH